MKSRRRRYVVDIGFQGRFMLGFVLATLVGSIAAAALFYFPAQSRLEQLQWSVFLRGRTIVEAVQPLFLRVSLASVIFAGLLLLLTWVRMMNRINGPLAGMIRPLERLAAGDFPAGISLRRRDEFGETARALNEMMSRIADRCREFEESYEEISRALGDLEAHAEGPICDRAARARGLVRRLRNTLEPAVAMGAGPR